MKDLVGVTIGIGAEHAALAHEAAARMSRLAGIEVVILGPRHLEQCGLRDPNHLKFRLFDLVNAQNVLYFDADAFCLRPWGPHAFAGGPEWLAVRGFWFDPRVERLGRLYGFGVDTFNSGLFLCNRRHHARVLRLAEALQPADNRFPGLVNPDEIALSTALHILRVPCRFLDRRYNWVQCGRGNLAAEADVIIAHACSAPLRQEYLRGSLAALAIQPVEESGAAVGPEFAGKTFLYERVGHDRRPLFFRDDGTIGAGGGNAERYYCTRPAEGDVQLVLGSAFDKTCTLTRGAGGVWCGRWAHHEQMPVTLTRHRGQVLIDLLAATGNRARPLTGVEVGVDRGETSALLLHGLPGLNLWMIDPWRATAPDALRRQFDCDRAFARAAEVTAFAAGRRALVPCDHARAASLLPDAPDLVFLDADHRYGPTLEAIAIWWPRLAPGGLLCGHDYGHPDYPGVKQAVDEFARQRGLKVRLAEDMVWYYEVKQ